jgi:hypothetical protein
VIIETVLIYKHHLLQLPLTRYYNISQNNSTHFSDFFTEHAVEDHLRHSLMNDGVLSRFANQQIRPLYDYDWHEERRMTGELEYFTLSVRLTISDVHKKVMKYFSSHH